MPRVVLQPASNPEAQRHYRDTIESPVPFSRIEPRVDPDVQSQLDELYPSQEAWVWGATPGSQNTSYVRQMSPGDLVLFYRRRRFISAATVTSIDMGNGVLAEELWGRNEEGETWEHIFFLSEPQDVDIPYHDVWEVARFGPENMLWGLTVLPQEESDRVLEVFDFGTEVERDPIQERGAEAAEQSLESGQGFAGSAEVRQALEDYSMELAKKYFEKRGFHWTDVSSNRPYDLRCDQGDLTIDVEVKGTQTKGEQVILTANEVQFARDHADRMVLFIVHSIEVAEDGDGNAEATGGTRKVYMPWDVDEGGTVGNQLPVLGTGPLAPNFLYPAY